MSGGRFRRRVQQLMHAGHDGLVALHPAAQFGDLRPGLPQRHALQLIGEHPGDGVQRVAVQLVGNPDHRIPHNAAIRHDHDQCADITDRHQLDCPNAGFLSLGGQHHSGVVSQAGKHLRGVVDHVAHLLHPALKVLLHALAVRRGNLAMLEQLIHIQAVGLGGGHATRRHMRLIQIPQLLQIAHFIANGGWAEVHVVSLRDRARPDGHRRQDVLIDDGLQNPKLSFVHPHLDLPPFGGC